jgi:hypothetical protein
MTNKDAVQLTSEQIESLKAAALAATPQDIDAAQRIEHYEDGSHIECPICGGDGYVELNADFCNYDGEAQGVQFYGIGDAHVVAEAYFRAAKPATVLALIERLERAESAPTAVQAAQAEGVNTGVIAAAEALIAADRVCDLTDEHVNALENAIAIQRGNRALPIAEQAEAVRVDVGPNLEGLREKLLAPRAIERTADGWLYHPDYPTCDEGTRADKFLEAFGIETRFVGAESDSPDFAERWIEEGLTDCSEWTPTPPTGDGWLLLEIYDTEDGPYAMFGRDWYAAERARKRANTLRLGEELRRRRAAALAAASAGDQEVQS